MTSVALSVPKKIDPSLAAGARTFYCDVLGGREVRRDDVATGNDRLLFIVGHTVIETGPPGRDEQRAIELLVDNVEHVATRCWDAGFTVNVPRCAIGLVPITIVDPFGLLIRLLVTN